MSGSLRVGVVGAGQLGRMLHQAAVSLGVDLHFLAASADDPAVAVAPSWRLGSATSFEDLAAFTAECDIVTFEHEVVDLTALGRLEERGARLHPSAAAMLTVADKVEMRAAVERAGVPVPPWCRVSSPAELAAARSRWGAIMAKSIRGGYDGRGVFDLQEPEGAQVATGLLAGGGSLMVEPRIALEHELAVIVARRPGGGMVAYEPVETWQVDGQCRQVQVPATVEPALADHVRGLAGDLASALDVVGLLAVEVFVAGGDVMVNELAVRPHNTGHHTIDACVTSQFENHLRAILDLPLGDPALRAPAVMVNVVGSVTADDPRARLSEAARVDPAARIHLYGKDPRPHRKLGHVTVCDTDIDRATRRAWQVVDALGGDVPATDDEVTR